MSEVLARKVYEDHNLSHLHKEVQHANTSEQVEVRHVGCYGDAYLTRERDVALA
jgi:hypothetical protein